MAKKVIKKTAAKKTKKPVVEIVDDSDNDFKLDSKFDEVEKATPLSSPEESNFDFDLPPNTIDADEVKSIKKIGTKKTELVTKTPSSLDPLAIYLNEIQRYPVLSREEEERIAKDYYETKNPEAAQKLVRANLRFVVKIAAEYSKFGARMIDLVQEGNVGLMHAVKEFNPYKGHKLITYAVWWIKGYIQEYLMRQYSMVRIGTTQNQRKLFYQLQKQKEQLDKLSDTPQLTLLSEKLGIPENEISEMAQRMSGRDISLDRPLDDDSTYSIKDLLRSEDGQMSLEDRLALAEQIEILKEKIQNLRTELNEKEKIILDERLLSDEPLTLQEIGEKYKITREAVRQAEVRVLKKIKDKMGIKTDNQN